MARLLDILGYPSSASDLPGRLAALARPDHAVLLAVDASETVVGLVGLHCFPAVHASAPVGYITALVTAPEARGHGVGRQLVEAAERWALERGCRRLTVTSAERREDAHAFYPACGLPYTGRRFSKALT